MQQARGKESAAVATADSRSELHVEDFDKEEYRYRGGTQGGAANICFCFECLVGLTA